MSKATWPTSRPAAGTEKLASESRRSELAKVRKQRQAALAKLNKEYGAGDRKLKAREQEQAELARVLKTIEETLARQAREAEEARRLARPGTAQQALATRTAKPLPGWGPPYRARCPAPAARSPRPRASCPGRSTVAWSRATARRAGDARATWDGVLIGASAGTRVHAMHGGRVVFADWLRGAGLLVISTTAMAT